MRDIVHAADPEIEETIKRLVQPYRMISIHEGDEINEPALVAMFAEIIANNRAGGWRKIKAERGEA